MSRSPLVFGPAYLDRVLRLDRRLVDPARGDPPLDGSVDGRWADLGGTGLALSDPAGGWIDLDLPADWPGPFGVVALGRPLSGQPGGWRRKVVGTAWGDHLGGMGAGYADALGGHLVPVLGSEDDPTSRAVARLLDAQGIALDPIRIPGHPADWTLLLSGGATGDKLAIGFRGITAGPPALGDRPRTEGRIRVAAAWPNRWIAEALDGPAEVRVFAPSARNMVDRDPPISRFAERIDLLACNRAEWEALEDREQVAWRVAVLAVTDGPAGAEVRFTAPDGEAGRVRVPAFPRDRPPRDTNRAGEAFAANLLLGLLEGGWAPGVADPAVVLSAANRASAAAALVIDRDDFGFPTPAEIAAALEAGRVA